MVSTLALASAGAASSYSWPFKPFNKQHPIRGYFGDPRTVYENGVPQVASTGRLLRSIREPTSPRRMERRSTRSSRNRALPRRGEAQRRHRQVPGERAHLPVLPHRPDRGRGPATRRRAHGDRICASAVRSRAPDGDQRIAGGQPVAEGTPGAVHRPHAADDSRRAHPQPDRVGANAARSLRAGRDCRRHLQTRRRYGFRAASAACRSRLRSCAGASPG